MEGGDEIESSIKNANTTRLLIAEKGMSLRGFSKEIGISQGYLSQVLKAIRFLHRKLLLRLQEG